MRCSIALTILTGCLTGTEPPTGDEHPDKDLPEVTGTITSDMTITASMRFEGQTVITTGVTVTVDPGVELVFGQDAILTVDGAFFVNGQVDKKVIARPAEGATRWEGIRLSGTVRLSYANFTSGSLTTNGFLAVLDISDSKLYQFDHDYIVMNGGKLNMMYSQLGPDDGETDTTHCNLHLNSFELASVLRSNIAGAPYGLMFYGGVGASFQLNNWYGASIKDVDTMPGVEGTFSGSWFEKGTPVAGPGAMITADDLATEKITQAGPRT